MVDVFTYLKPALPTAFTLAAVVAVLIGADRLLKRGAAKDSESDFRNKLLMLGLSLTCLIVLIVVIPITPDTRGQLLGFLGIVLSATVALSSTTILGNAMAGLMLRAVGNFRVGDFVRIEKHFGRVTERGLFHTEIQTEERDLITLPNLYLVTNSVNVIRSSGHILRASISLGYDVPRGEVERCLLAAAEAAGLEDPFVHILDLGDFSVTYRVAGLLKEVKSLLTKRSVLRVEMMDALHGAGIEIVSPTFMNQRVYQTSEAFVPRPVAVKKKAKPAAAAPEDVAFDKAEKAETLESLRTDKVRLGEEIAALGESVKKAESDAEKERFEAEIARLTLRGDGIDAAIARRESDKPDGSD